MRDIKFRAWDDENSVMLYGSDFDLFNEHDNGVHAGCMSNGDWVQYELMQCTGKSDQLGCEIYEGDIVSSDFWLPDFKCVAEVVFELEENYGRFGFKSSEQDAFRYGNLTVIGNIHQNPELLEVAV